MVFAQRNFLEWIALAGLGAIAMLAGCASIATAPPAAIPPAASADATDADSAVAQRPPRPEDGAFESDAPDVPQSVNVFGEINGVSLPSAGNPADGGFQQHTYADEGYDSDVTVDPTGVWLAFASTRHSPHASIYLQRTDGSAVVQLTSDKGEDAYPTFSPDGKQIAFSSTRAGNWQVYLMDADGRNTTQVTSGPMQAIHPSFSPDGTRMVYAALGSRSNQWELWTVNLASGEKRMIGNGLFPSWSPDKTVDRIAFQRARQRGSRWFSVWTMELSNGEAHRVTEVAESARAAVLSPTWSTDGKSLAFATIAAPSRGDSVRRKGQSDIWVINADGTNRRRLTDGNGNNLTPCWARDNRVYFVSDRAGPECIWSAQADQNRTIATGAPPVPAASGEKAVGATDAHEAAQ